ncbi:MAG: HAMP domain-containing histidine kinase [Alphaproteobacteria bacterium]|nr:HAMP domain-containing histidine kinase [Alphaproteobacteria bacterium]
MNETSSNIQNACVADHLATMGQVAPALAHDVNSLSGIALTSATVLAGDLDDMRALLGEGKLTRAALDAFIDRAGRSNAIVIANLRRVAELVASFRHIVEGRRDERDESLSLRPFLEEVVRSAHPILRSLPHHLEIECPEFLSLTTKQGVLARVLVNLLINTARHAGDVRPLTLRLSAAPTSDGGVEIGYGDDGQGIPPEILSRVFEPYFTTRQGDGGSGLGLPIVKHLVESSLGGSLTLDSAPDRGVQVTIRLPSRSDQS